MEGVSTVRNLSTLPAPGRGIVAGAFAGVARVCEAIRDNPEKAFTLTIKKNTVAVVTDGTAVLDFNQAYNPPCSFNPYTTCPLPPKENRLTVRILAGERAYPHPPTHTGQ